MLIIHNQQVISIPNTLQIYPSNFVMDNLKSLETQVNKGIAIFWCYLWFYY